MDSSHIVNSLVLMLATLAMLFEKTCIAGKKVALSLDE